MCLGLDLGRLSTRPRSLMARLRPRRARAEGHGSVVKCTGAHLQPGGRTRRALHYGRFRSKWHVMCAFSCCRYRACLLIGLYMGHSGCIAPFCSRLHTKKAKNRDQKQVLHPVLPSTASRRLSVRVEDHCKVRENVGRWPRCRHKTAHRPRQPSAGHRSVRTRPRSLPRANVPVRH